MAKKHPDLRDAERGLERRRQDVIDAAVAYEAADGDGRTLLVELREAVRDYHLARATRDRFAAAAPGQVSLPDGEAS